MGRLPKFRLVSRTELKNSISYYLESISLLGPIYVTVRGKVVAKLEAVKQEGKINGD